MRRSVSKNVKALVHKISDGLSSIDGLDSSTAEEILSAQRVVRFLRGDCKKYSLEMAIKIMVSVNVRVAVTVYDGGLMYCTNWNRHTFKRPERKDVESYIRVLRERIKREVFSVAHRKGISIPELERINGLSPGYLSRQPNLATVDLWMDVLISLKAEVAIAMDAWCAEYPVSMQRM